MLNKDFFKNWFLNVSYFQCFLCLCSGWLQSCHHLLPILHYGEFLLAPSRGPVPPRPIGCLFLLREEILLVVHPDWLGWVTNICESVCTGRYPTFLGSIFLEDIVMAAIFEGSLF